MKKTLAILLAVVLVAVMMPTAIFAGAATDAEKAIWDQLFLKSDGVEIDYDACTLTAGSAVTFKATIPAGGYVQFMQKVSDVIGSTKAITIVPGSDTLNDYQSADFNLQMTTNKENEDIVPAKNHADTISWAIKTPSGSHMWLGHGATTSTAGFTTYTWSNRIGSDCVGRGVNLIFPVDETTGEIFARNSRNDLVNASVAGVYEGADKTAADIGATDGVYFRLRSTNAQTYTVTINSADISAAYRDGNYILSDRESTVDAESVKCTYDAATGMSTYTANITLAKYGSYVQFGKKLTDLVGGGATVKIAIGDGAESNYTSAALAVQLTADGAATKDIIPVDEGSNDPGVKGMTWSFAGNGTLVLYAGKGSKTPGAFDQSIRNKLVPNGGIGLRFNLNQDGTVVYAPTYNPYQPSTPQASTKTLAQIGGENGVYFRLRNQKSAAITYTITVTTKAVPYTDGAYKFSDEGSKLVSTTRTVADGKVSETATVKVSGNGGYVQLDRKLVDLVGGGATVKIATQNNTRAEYEDARFTVQLTADGEAKTDIVPVDERTVDPGVLGVSWSFDGGSNIMYVGKGSRTNSAFDQSISNKIVPSSGVGLRFNLNQDGTVVYAPTHNPYNASTPEASTKTLAQIGGENGVYFRLRNWLDIETTYVITVTYANVFGADAENGTVTLDKTAALTGETVTATVNAADNYQLKAGSLKYVMNGKEYPITTRVGDESVSNVFTFAMPEDAVTVKAEFVPADAVNTALLGASYNIENGEIGKDMRFVTRAYRKAGNKTLTRCGNYLLRKDSPLGQQLAEGVALTKEQIKELTNPTGEQVVKLVPTTVLNDRCADYVDFTLRIKNVGTDTYKGVEYICISYTEFEEDGVYEYFYSTPCIRSYDYIVGALN